jgi:excinuclease UvrABC nuclease subunit
MINPSSLDLTALPSLCLSRRAELPKAPAVYFAIDSLAQVQYIGQSINLRQRWANHHHRQQQLDGIGNITIAWLEISELSLRREVEEALIQHFDPPFNGLRNELGGLSHSRLKSKLPDLMKEKGVDKKTVAAVTGLSPTTVGKFYRSHFDRIDNHTVTELCKYFGLRKLDDLLELVWEAGDGSENDSSEQNESLKR